MPDSRDFISADEFEFISNDTNHKSNIGKKENQNILNMSDEWTAATNVLSGGTNLIQSSTIADIWDFPVDNVFFDDSGSLWFEDPTTVETDSTGCVIGDGLISLSKLSGDLDLLKDFDKINNFGKIYDIQFKDITHGQYKYANTRICNILAQSLGFLSLDKLVNDERIRQTKANELNSEFSGTPRESDFPPYSGFLVDPLYLSEGWINFDQVVHDRLGDEWGYDGDASIAIRTKRFKEAKRVLVQLAITYSSNIPVLGSHNKITDFGIRVIDRTTSQVLDLSNFKNDMNSQYSNSGVATYTGKLEYITQTEIENDVVCNPCSKYKIVKCEGTIYKEEGCPTSEAEDLGVSHEIAPQFRLNPNIGHSKNKPDILNTIDPIHWTGGTQNFTEDQWRGITKLREEFGEDNLHSGRLTDSRAFHYAAGDFDGGFTVGGFSNEVDVNTDLTFYGSRKSTEQWDGKSWNYLPDYNLPVSRSSGLAGSDKGTYNIIAFGTRGVHTINGENGDVLSAAATPVPSFFETNYETSKTESMDSDLGIDWNAASCAIHTNVPRHSVAGVIKASKSFVTADGNKLDAPTVDNCAGSTVKLSSLIGSDIDDPDANIDINIPNDVFSTLGAFVRDSSRRAAGKGTATSLKLIGPNYDPDDALIKSRTVPYIQDPSDQTPTPCFSKNTKGAMDFIIKKNTGTTDNYLDSNSVDVAPPIGVSSEILCATSGADFGELASSVESWEYPVTMSDGSIIFVDKSNEVDQTLLRDGQSVDAGDWYEIYNASGIAFNGSTGGMVLNGVTDDDLSDVFEYFHYVKFVQHTTKRVNSTTYTPVTFTFENGSFCVDPNRKYPIKTVGTKYVGDQSSGLATGGKTSNRIFGCSDNSASLNIKYGYFSDEKFSEFNNSIVNLAYELSGDSWIRRDNLPENVAWHTGVGDKNHAIFWGGIHASLETPDIAVAFPGCDDWFKAIESFGGTFNIRGNRGLDGEERYTFFGTRYDDKFENTYYKSDDIRDTNELGVVYSAEWLTENDPQVTQPWSDRSDRTFSHVYFTTYANEDNNFLVNYYVNGESWIGDLSASEVIPDYEGFAHGERTDTVGIWLKDFMDQDKFPMYLSSYRPDLDSNSLNGGNITIDANGIFPTRFNYFLNSSEDRNPVWKYSGHPVEGGMWIWSRPNPGEELFDPRSIHAEPTESGEWQSESIWNKHSFQNHIGYESFFSKWEKDYDDLEDNYSFANTVIKDNSKFVYWVCDKYDPIGDNTFSTLYEYDAEKMDKFYNDFSGSTDSSVAWQHYLSREAGRVRVRSEDVKYKIEYITVNDWLPETGVLTIKKSGTIVPGYSSSTKRIDFLQRLPETINQAYTYNVSFDNTALGITNVDVVSKDPCGFTIDIRDDKSEFESVHSTFTFTDSTSATYDGVGFVGTDAEACSESINEGTYGQGEISWSVTIDIRLDFLEMYLHGTNKNLNQNHGTPLSAIKNELRAYNENQDTSQVDLFTVENMQFLLDYHFKLGNISQDKLAPPFITHVPEEGMSTPSDSFVYSLSPYETNVYQDVFTDPNNLPPYSQLVLNNHYPAAPVTTNNWFLARYALDQFYTSDVTPVQRKILSYTKTDTENPLNFRYKDIIATDIDPDNGRRIMSPLTLKKFIEDYKPDLNRYGFNEYTQNRYVNHYYPDSILSSIPGSTYSPILDEDEDDRWNYVEEYITIYDPNNESSGKTLSNPIVIKNGTLGCIIDNTTLTTLTGLTSSNAFTDIDDLSLIGQEDNLFVISGSNVTLYGRNITDSIDPEYNNFRYLTSSEVIGSPLEYSTAQASYPCLSFPQGYDLDPNFRVYHSMFSSNQGGYFGAFIPTVGTVTSQAPLFYPDWMSAGGLVWTGSNNSSSIITPQANPLYTINTGRKIVFDDSSLKGSIIRLPAIDETLSVGDTIISVSDLYRDIRGMVTPDYAVSLSNNKYAPYVSLEKSRLQLYRTNKNLINLLTQGNKVDIFGGLFDAFWFNNITTFAPTDSTFINPEPRLRGYSTPAWDTNATYYENWNYGWNSNSINGRFTDTFAISGGASYTGDFEDVPSNYTQDFIVNIVFDTPVSDFLTDNTTDFDIYVNYQGTGTPVVSNKTANGFDLTIEDWYPLVRETFTDTITSGVFKTLVETCRTVQYDIVYTFKNSPSGNIIYDPFNQTTNPNRVVYSEQDVNHEKFRVMYDDNHIPTLLDNNNFSVLDDSVIYDKAIDDISYAYHYGYERAFIDPLADVAGDNMTVAYDYYRYRFLDLQSDVENWMYVPYTGVSENNIFKLNNFATSEDTPEYMTYSFYMDRMCDGLDQFFYGQDNNQFVERWKFPHSSEVLNNLKVTAQIDGINKLVTKSNGEYVDIQEYKPLVDGSLSVGKFVYPRITGSQIRNGIENPLKDVIYQISENTCEGVDVNNFVELNSWLDGNNISGSNVNCYYPLSYDPYAGNSELLPNLPYFKETNTNFRFDSTKKSSSIRDRAALWPWCDLINGDSTSKPVQGNYTWHFTKDGKFWIAEVVKVGVREKDPLNRTITTEVYDGDESEEVYRIRCYTRKAKLLFDYNLTYHDHAGPEFFIDKTIASDFNVFGTELKTKEIALELFSNRPINGPDMIDNLNKNELVWQAIEWNHFSVNVDEMEYRYRHKELCDVIREGYNRGTVPSEGKFCKVSDVSKIWVYSIPFSDNNANGVIRDQALWIEENPLAVTEYISGSGVGYYDVNNTLIENIIDVGVSGSSGAPLGSQIIYKKSYNRSDGNVGLRYSRALVSGPTSRGIGLFNWGKSQAYNGDLLHYGDREYVRYSASDDNFVIPSEDDLYEAWPWNVIGNGGALGARGYTDTIDISGNYWFAFGDRDNLVELEQQTSNDVNFKQSYIIGMISASNVDNIKTALMKTNYIQAIDTKNVLELSEQNPSYIEFGLLEAEIHGSRLRDGILEVVNGYEGHKYFDLFVYLIDENVVNVSATGFEEQYEIAFADSSPTASTLPALPLPPLDVSTDKPEIVQDLFIINSNDSDCMVCEVCDTGTNYSDLENPTPWLQHNHDDWVAPFLESPFSGPYNSDGFNIWLTAGKVNPWGTQIWSRLENGKVWTSYRRQRLHVDPVRNKLILMAITGTIAIESFAEINDNNLNIPVYCTYDEFLYNLEDYAELDIVKNLTKDSIAINMFKFGKDCSDDFAVHNPIFVNSEPVSSCSIDPSGCLSEGISGNYICPDNTPNEVYTEWATGFIQEYKSRQQKSGGSQMERYYFKYNVANTYDSNTFLEPETITDKEIVGYDWRRYQDGVGCGGAVPLLTLLDTDDLRCISLNECYVGQASFGTPDKAIVFGGFAVPADGQSGENIWWARYTAKGTFKWNTSVISPEDDLNNNYRNRTTSPFFTNGEQTLSRMTLGMLMFDLGKEAIVERQGIAQFNQQNEVDIVFVDEIPDFFTNNDKYSIVLQPDQNVKTWWAEKTPTGFKIKVELDEWTGSVDWQVVLVDTIPPDEVDGVGENETFDKWDNL